MINASQIKQVHALSLFNRTVLEKGGEARCFHCGGVFDGREVKQWISEADGRDDSAWCPNEFCVMDTVVTKTDFEKLGLIEVSFQQAIQAVKDEYFGQSYENDLEDERNA